MSLLAIFVFIIGVVHRATGDACTWTWETPAGASALTKSVDAEVVFAATVTGPTLADGHVISLMSGSTTLNAQAWAGTATPPAFAAASSNVVSATFTETDSGSDKTYTFTIPAGQLKTTHSGDITITNSACTSGDLATTAIALTVKYCDEAIAGGTYTSNNCQNTCEGTFECTAATGLTFTATCQADASWSTTTTPPAAERCKSCDVNAFSGVTNPGSPQNANLCGAGCTKTFTCDNYPSVTFEATCQDGDTWSATVPSQDDRCSLTCKDTWVWNQPGGVNTLTLSVGAPFQFQASVDDDLVVNDVVQWKISSDIILITDTYNAQNAFDSVAVVTGVTTTFEAQSDGFGNKYTVNIPENFLTDTDHNGESVTVRSETCDDADGKVSPGVTLTVKYCDTTSFADGTYSGNACGYNCVAEFACNANDATGLTFQATCQADATWSASTPPTAQRCKSCDLTEFSGQSVTNPGSAENTDLCGVDCVKTFKCTAGESVTFQATCQQDLTWSATTPIESERCTRCDLTSFSGSSVTNPGTAENDDACIVGCEKTFKCSSDESLTFKATCQQDLTWGDTTPTEAQRCQKSSSISSTRGAVLTWVILASIACITFEVEL